MSQPPKIIISPLLAPSTLSQADLIKKLLEEKGYEVEYKKLIGLPDIRNSRNYAFLWVQLLSVHFIGSAQSPYLMCKKPKAIYVTIEGFPTKANLLYTNLTKLQYIANSEFTKGCLEQVGLTVIDVVHHAIDLKEVEQAKEHGKTLRKKLKKQYQDKVLFLYVGRNDPRKGLNILSEAINMLNEKRKDDYVVLLHSEETVTGLFPQENVHLISTVGSLSHQQVYQLYHACDYVVFPTMCEGFGLPLLEANACGKPVIHALIPPLTEFTCKYCNFVFDYVDTQMVKCGLAQYWVFHRYPPHFLADMMEFALDTYLNEKRQYRKFCNVAERRAKKYDYHEIYPKLLKHIGVE